MNTDESVEDILKRTKKISRQELRSKTAGGGRSSPFSKFKKLALALEPGGEAAEVNRLTESQVSSIRTQVNHLNPDDADDDEKEFVATRRKKVNDAGEDVTDDKGNQLYDLFIKREVVDDGQKSTEEASQEPEEKKSRQNGEKDSSVTEVEEDFEGMWD